MNSDHKIIFNFNFDPFQEIGKKYIYIYIFLMR